MDVEAVTFHASDWVPNNQELPVLVYNAPIPDGGFESLFARNGWAGIWTNGVFTYQHYHSGAHEVLGVASGSATLLIGGPGGREFALKAGSCLILPAGTGHQNLGSSADFQVVGAYPPRQHADIQTSAATEEMVAKIKGLPLPDTDPVQGPYGALTKLWRKSTTA
ncbi:cupin domain-containing protein [Aliirhizobium cellulosilyticum]|uniref:Uncharacterized protein YjlB n=1 Tax=Aliirhizobium cellulosilyticum TaxID=393664 RepID=A0A7W6SDK5_9HYPH|nr:cupin domain-containing protein [Rhizobium cellulosilyticum]MBB4351791.1 uncharacterized protein YjlB [Rhizobium cellulosilyticum]MBB4414914.1 uncharacterized protein YjlB [Rhizobium cellulosilyticum]MBB4449724.1 uncharacterized protein YjlB [Rhizobium cellulosilyticum]